MASKTWKLGEVCRGGVITVEVSKTKVAVIAKEWDTTKGFSKGSDQSKAKEWNRLEVSTTNSVYKKLEWFLFDLTTSYWTDQIMDWIYSKTTFNQNDWR